MVDQNQGEAMYVPKILFVHDYRPEARVLTDLMRQLLLGYPTEKLHWWYCREMALYGKPDLTAASVDGFRIPNKLAPHARWNVYGFETNLKKSHATDPFLLQYWIPETSLREGISRVIKDMSVA